MKRKIGVIGAGGWGTAIALLLAKNGHAVTLWARREELCRDLLKHRENTAYLPGVLLPANIGISNSLEQAVKSKDIVVLATPAKAVRTAIEGMKDFITKDTIIVSLSKGLERNSILRLSQVISQVVGNEDRVVVISGPNHAEEVARGIPTATVAAGYSLEMAQQVQEVFMTPKFRVYTNTDVVGVELAGALKNVIALGAGVCDGLGYGDNTKATLMTRGLAEIARLGIKLGAETITFAGLAGIGDLIATCTSKHSRNWQAGFALGQGESLEDIRKGMVVEGVATTETAALLALQEGVSMPITTALHQVIFAGKHPHQAVSELMLRDKAHEIEDILPQE
jgi:glycerol-3-phosphate dehydrogenase (NAD(P)+)